MKKSLVVYYSRTGLTKKIANLISRSIPSDIDEIAYSKTKAPNLINYLTCAIQAVKKSTPQISTIKKDPLKYDNILICSPVWAGLIANPIRSYLKNNIKPQTKINLLLTQQKSGAKLAILDLKKSYKIKKVLILESKEIQKDSFDDLRVRFFAKEI